MLLAAAFLALAGTVRPVSGAESVGQVISVEGQVEVMSGGETVWKPLTVKSPVYRSDTIKTGAVGQAEIFLLDETTFNIGPRTTVKVEKFVYSAAGNQRESRINILMGNVKFQVRRFFSQKSTFEVSTPTTVAGVKGTRFIVWVISPELTRTAVLDGEVLVRNILATVSGEVLLHSNTFTDIQLSTPPAEPKPMGTDTFSILPPEIGTPSKAGSASTLKALGVDAKPVQAPPP